VSVLEGGIFGDFFLRVTLSILLAILADRCRLWFSCVKPIVLFFRSATNPALRGFIYVEFPPFMPIILI